MFALYAQSRVSALSPSSTSRPSSSARRRRSETPLAPVSSQPMLPLKSSVRTHSRCCGSQVGTNHKSGRTGIFTQYLCVHRSSLVLYCYSGTHMLKLLCELDRSKLRMHALSSVAYDGGSMSMPAAPSIGQPRQYGTLKDASGPICRHPVGSRIVCM
jgi:hypothetical protein